MKHKIIIEVEVDTDMYDDVKDKQDCFDLVVDAIHGMADWPPAIVKGAGGSFERVPVLGMKKKKLNDEKKSKKEVIETSDMWESNWSGFGHGGMDLAAYVSGGMSVWPCGATFQEGGRDGFDEDIGMRHCTCKICEAVRQS